MEPMEMDNADKHQSVIESLFEERIKSLENEINNLAKEVENKNNLINQTNTKYIDLLKENDLLKCDISSLQDVNSTYKNELLHLQKLLPQADISADNFIDVADHQNSFVLHNKLNELIENLNKKSVEFDFSKKLDLQENIENSCKLQHSNSQLVVLKEKNELSEKFIKSKDDYIRLLLKYIDSLKENSCTLESSLKEEIDVQNELMLSIKNENVKLKSQNKLFIESNISFKKQFEHISAKYTELEKTFNETQAKQSNEIVLLKKENEQYRLEINKLNDLLKKSKDDIMDQYLERFYPNIASIGQMFNKQFSISELYSHYLENKKMNEDLLIEKSVLEDRVKSLNEEVENMKFIIDNNIKEINVLKDLDSKILHLENDKKEQSISLKFYQESAQNLYKGSKIFYENFVNLTDKIRLLVQHETTQDKEDSTGLMALKYIMELQNKFQEFKKLQSEFEKRKLDFIQEKQNLIENDNQFDSLKDQIMILETEKRQFLSKYELLDNEYNMLRTLFENFKTNSESEFNKLQNINNDLNKKLDMFSKENEELKSKLNVFDKNLVGIQKEKSNIESKLNNQTKDLEFSQERLSIQQKLVNQLETSLRQLRSQNAKSREINQQLENTLKNVEENYLECKKKLVEFESQISGYKFELEMLKNKENVLIQRLTRDQQEAINQQDVNFILNSVKENTIFIENCSLNKLNCLKTEKETLDQLYQQKQKQWQEERCQLNAKITDLESLFQNETAKLNELKTDYMKLQEIKNSINFDETSSNVDEILKSENQLFRSQLESFTRQTNELNNELNSFKQKFNDLMKENVHLLELKSQLEAELSSVKGENSTKTSQLNTLKNELESKSVEFQNKLGKIQEEHKIMIEKQNLDLKEKNTACELYLKQIENLNILLAESNSKLEQKLSSEKFQLEQIKSLGEANSKLQIQNDMASHRNVENANTISELRKRIDDLQSRYMENESNRIKQEEKALNKYEILNANYRNLQNEYNDMKTNYVKLKELNQKFCEQLNEIGQKILQNTQCSNQAQLVELANLKDTVELYSSENTLLHAKCKTFEIKEMRLNNEIESLRRNISNLEDCLEKEKENFANLSSLLNSQNKTDQIQFLSESVKKMRHSNEELEKRCAFLDDKVVQLGRELESANNKAFDKILDDNKMEIDMLKNQLSLSTNKMNQLNDKLKIEIEKNTTLDANLKNISAKFSSQEYELESLRKELNSNLTTAEKYLKELNSLKSFSSSTDEERNKLKKEVESLKNEITSIQNTNQQLKMLARKYKSQCDEFQKQHSNNKGVATEEKLKTLESQVQDTSSENEKLKAELTKLNQENENLRLQANEKDQKAKMIAQQAKQKLFEQRQLISNYQNEVATLKSNLTKTKASQQNQTLNLRKSGKSPISSTFVSASLQQPSTSSFDASTSSNLQPSSSIEDNDRLQSAHITSHTTSIDDNSSEFSSTTQSQVSGSSNIFSNKRNLPDCSDSGQDKKRRIDIEGLDYEQLENSNQSVVNVEEDSNDVSETQQTDQLNCSQSTDELNLENNEQQASDNAAESNDGEQSTEQPEQIEPSDSNASSSQFVSRPSSIDFNSPSTSSSFIVDNSDLMQPGPSFQQAGPSSSSSSSNYLTVPSHASPFFNTQINPSSNIRPTSERNRVSISLSSIGPRFLIPQPDMLSPPNPIITPNLGPSCMDEGDGIVPSTPVLFVSRFEDNAISPQVPQSRFVFSNSSGSIQTEASISNMPTTPTISETVSSVISVDEAVAEFEQNVRQVEEVMPSSSEIDVSNNNQQSNNDNSTRARRLKIRGSSRGR